MLLEFFPLNIPNLISFLHVRLIIHDNFLSFFGSNEVQKYVVIHKGRLKTNLANLDRRKFHWLEILAANVL